MIKELLFSLKSPNRDNYEVYGFRFGNKNAKGPSIAIVSGFLGCNINQIYASSRLVEFMRRKTSENPHFINGSVLIIPAVNIFGLNMGQNFWPHDKSDIDSMFPGVVDGETTQRIAFRLFEKLQGFDYGVVLEGGKDRAVCMPYLHLLQTEYEDLDSAREFGFQFIYRKEPSAMDNSTLLYNWQLSKTKAFSIVWGEDSKINESECSSVIDSVVRFLSKKLIINHTVLDGYSSNITNKSNIESVKASNAGIFLPTIKPGSSVLKGEFLGFIKDSMTGAVLEKLYASADGVISCIYAYPLIFENSVAFKIAS